MGRFDYENRELLHADDFNRGFAQWHHEGAGAADLHVYFSRAS